MGAATPVGPAGGQVSWFETEILPTRKNLKPLMDVPGKWIDRAGGRRSRDKLILDLNSSVSETYGRRSAEVPSFFRLSSGPWP